MPGLMVSAWLPLRLTAPWEVRPLGTARPASGSVKTAAFAAYGLREALPEVCTPPTTWMAPADSVALAPALMAEVELESTSTRPLSWRLAFPDRVRAPAAPRSRT